MLISSKYRKNHNLAESLSKLFTILKVLNKKSILSLFYLLSLMVIAAFIELSYLISLSQFINYLIVPELNQINGDSIIENNFYSKIILFLNNFTSSQFVANGFSIIIVTIISLLARLFVLKTSLSETARIGSLVESKCGEKLSNVKYEYIKDLKGPDVVTNFQNVPRFVSSIIQQGLLAISSLIIISFIIFYLNSSTYNHFLIAFIILALIYSLILILGSRKMKNISLNLKKFYFQRTSSLTYIVRMFRQIQIEQKKSKVSNNYSLIANSLYNFNSISQFFALFPKILIEHIAIICIAILFMIQTSIYGSTNSISNIGVFLLAILRILPSLQTIFVFLVNLKKKRYVIDSVYNLLNLPQEININLNDNNQKIDFINKNIFSIKLKNISFRYKGKNKNVIENLSYEFKSGKSYALVGTSGAGKSTLIDLFLNLLSPSEGMVLINNKYALTKDSRGLFNTNFLRANTFLIGQNDFNGGSTLREILEISDKNLDDFEFLKRLKYAIKCLKLDEIFRDQFVDKFVGENATQISGGQRQRLFLIRAFLSQKKILIFDEVTSSLDEKSKEIVIKLIFNSNFLTKDKIFIFSTHSKTLAKNCDEIITLNKII